MVHRYRPEGLCEHSDPPSYPIVERAGAEGLLTPQSIGGKTWGEFLIAVFDEWVRRDLEPVFVQLFDVALGVWFDQPAALCNGGCPKDRFAGAIVLRTILYR